MIISVGSCVDHIDYGPGIVKQVLGRIAVVDFYGDEIECNIAELNFKDKFEARVIDKTESNRNRISFRRSFEAVNLGVVPPDSSYLVSMSIGGDSVAKEVNKSLTNANLKGLCKVVFGNYGTGKSHYLHLVSVIAKNSGWVVSYLEFDPKAVDPAKPHLVYREIMAKLKFPDREDGSSNEGFRDLVKEIRAKWSIIRDLPHVKASPWFRHGLETLQYFPHNDDPGYIGGCGWLAGQNVLLSGPGSIRELARKTNTNPNKIPNMPKVRETAEIYVHHLVVINEICKALGYKGLLIILDEAEHVRGFNVRRKERANNLFDFLARSTHPPIKEGDPILNDHGHQLPRFWENGPHFGLYVGLTEGATFEDKTLSLREACVFLHSENDRIILQVPAVKEYELWCRRLLSDCHNYYPDKTSLLSTEEAINIISAALRKAFNSNQNGECVIRTWVKLACLVPSVIFSNRSILINDLISIINTSANELSGGYLPWE